MYEQGLSESQARKLLLKYGLNILPEKPPPGNFATFISQFKNPLVYVLVVAGTITTILGHFPDTILIFLAVIVNSILGFVQEKKANTALYSLKKFISQKTEVIRNGKRKKIDVSKVVPGDIIILSQGSKVPADGQLTFANRICFDEAIISGESVPATKRENEPVFMGTTVVSGQGVMKVITTGKNTKVGRIALTIQETKEDTPLKRQLSNFSKKLVYIILVLTFFVFIIGLARGEKVVDIFKISIALSVSSIPEGLIVSMTAVLAIGMQRILKRKGLVRKLVSAETLGGVTTICLDKTGTLTEGKMKVTNFSGNQNELAQQITLANDLDDPLVIAGFEWGRAIIKDSIQKHLRLDSIPFSPKERFFASLHKWDNNKNIIFVNGAPDILLKWCDISHAEAVKIQKDIKNSTSQGERVIGLAKKAVSKDKTRLTLNDAKKNLTWVGMLSFSDPVRHGVKDALDKAHKAGIKLMVITGDYPQTARHVLNQLGIFVKPQEIMLGDSLEKYSEEEISKKIRKIKLFARTTPEQKSKIVKALKKNNEIVAMMGDGVNDASALHESDIGIVVAEASDVARETADLVLLDSNFSTVVAAIEEGRGIFDNIRKIILYLMSDAFGEIVVVIGGIFMGLPLPITAVQILWINLVSDGFPFLALTVDPKRKDIMQTKPRSPKEKLVNNWMISLIGIVSLVSGIFALLFFIWVYSHTQNTILARSIAFITLGFNSLIYVFSIRTLLSPFWLTNHLENKWLIAGVMAGFGLQILPFTHPILRSFFNITTPSIIYWIGALFLAIALFFIVEAFKLVYRFRLIK